MSQILVHTACLPPISYMAAVVRSEKVYVEGWETYPKQTNRNHCHIYGPNGRQKLTIPVSRPDGNHTRTRDIVISDHEPWQRTHWRSIETAYSNSPFFLFYSDEIRAFFEKPERFLLDYNTKCLVSILKILNLKIEITHTEAFVNITKDIPDLRSHSIFSPKPEIFPRYIQTFEPVHGFIPNLSILDAIFNLGPGTLSYLNGINFGEH